MSLLFETGKRPMKNRGERLFNAIVFNIPNVGDFVPQVCYLSFYIFWINKVVHILKLNSIGSFVSEFNGMKLRMPVQKGFCNNAVRVRILGWTLT
jgi:hypothetical protein